MSQWWVCIYFEASRFYPEVSDASTVNCAGDNNRADLKLADGAQWLALPS